MQPTHLIGAQLFSFDIFSFEILTFIEIEIDITTGGHGLKYDFYFSLFIKSDFFQILGFSSYSKNLECRMLIKNFVKDVPYFAAHDMLKCYLVSFSRYILIQTILYLNTMNKTNMTRREISLLTRESASRRFQS